MSTKRIWITSTDLAVEDHIVDVVLGVPVVDLVGDNMSLVVARKLSCSVKVVELSVLRSIILFYFDNLTPLSLL